MSPEFNVVQGRVHGEAQYHAISLGLYVVQGKGRLKSPLQIFFIFNAFLSV
jgi:hypothetical protein